MKTTIQGLGVYLFRVYMFGLMCVRVEGLRFRAQGCRVWAWGSGFMESLS